MTDPDSEPHNQRCDNDCAYFGEATAIHEVNIDHFKVLGKCLKINCIIDGENTHCVINESSKRVIDTIGCASYAPRRREYNPVKELKQ
jgi:hypothetical protein